MCNSDLDTEEGIRDCSHKTSQLIKMRYVHINYKNKSESYYNICIIISLICFWFIMNPPSPEFKLHVKQSCVYHAYHCFLHAEEPRKL